jgi:hypothetical protein
MTILGRLAGITTMAALVAAGGTAVAGAAMPAKTPGACTVVTNTELESATGVPFEAGEDEGGQGGPGTSACRFESADVDATVVVTTAAKGKAKQAFSVRILELGSDKKSQRVPGLGKRANFLFTPGSLPRATLVVVDGKKGVSVYSTGPGLTKSTALEQSTAIAEAVLPAL